MSCKNANLLHHVEIEKQIPATRSLSLSPKLVVLVKPKRGPSARQWTVQLILFTVRQVLADLAVFD